MIMDFRKFDKTYYIRIDKGEEIISSILEICKREKIASAVYSAIGGCCKAEIQTFLPEEGKFETNTLEGMLELISMNGNITSDDEGIIKHHTHATFAYIRDGNHCVSGGHVKSATVLYTAEIELRPVIDGVIKRKPDSETGTGFWHFTD